MSRILSYLASASRQLADIEERLYQATKEISTRGVPIIHVEAHGSKEGFHGPGGVTGLSSAWPWEQVGDVLRPLNIASRFNLLVVGAACYGEGPILAIVGGKPMPFTTLIGYSDTIATKSLRDSMEVLYKRLLVDKEELGNAVEAADREHHFSDDAILRFTSPAVLAMEGFMDAAHDRIGPSNRESYALDTATRVLRANGYDLSLLPYSTTKAQAPVFFRRLLEAGWRVMWMMDDIPENETRFAIDFDRAVEIATQGEKFINESTA